MKIITERIEFQTAAQLVAAIEKLAGGLVRLDEMYVSGPDGELGSLALEQETLSDGSVAFNLVIDEAEGDPDS